jgi:hypothetical protein
MPTLLPQTDNITVQGGAIDPRLYWPLIERYARLEFIVKVV